MSKKKDNKSLGFYSEAVGWVDDFNGKIGDFLYYKTTVDTRAQMCLSIRDFGLRSDIIMVKDGRNRYYFSEPKIIRRYDSVMLSVTAPLGKREKKKSVRIICVRGNNYHGKTHSVVFTGKIADIIEKQLVIHKEYNY